MYQFLKKLYKTNLGIYLYEWVVNFIVFFIVFLDVKDKVNNY